jgi:hypothetical protein
MKIIRLKSKRDPNRFAYVKLHGKALNAKSVFALLDVMEIQFETPFS